jgi:hypothetical protein
MQNPLIYPSIAIVDVVVSSGEVSGYGGVNVGFFN